MSDLADASLRRVAALVAGGSRRARRRVRRRIRPIQDAIATAQARAELEASRDRVAALDGTLVLDSPPGASTRITAELPLS